MIKVTDSFLRKLVTFLNGSTVSISAFWVRLFTSVAGNDISRAASVADFTDASYSGYVPRSMTPGSFSPPFLSDDGLDVIESFQVNEFRPTDGTIPNVIAGYFVADDSSTGLVFWGEIFDSGIPLTDENNRIALPLRFGLDVNGNFDKAVISE